MPRYPSITTPFPAESEELLEIIEAISEKTGVPRSEVTRMCFRAALLNDTDAEEMLEFYMSRLEGDNFKVGASIRNGSLGGFRTSPQAPMV